MSYGVRFGMLGEVVEGSCKFLGSTWGVPEESEEPWEGPLRIHGGPWGSFRSMLKGHFRRPKGNFQRQKGNFRMQNCSWG